MLPCGLPLKPVVNLSKKRNNIMKKQYIKSEGVYQVEGRTVAIHSGMRRGQFITDNNLGGVSTVHVDTLFDSAQTQLTTEFSRGKVISTTKERQRIIGGSVCNVVSSTFNLGLCRDKKAVGEHIAAEVAKVESNIAKFNLLLVTQGEEIDAIEAVEKAEAEADAKAEAEAKAKADAKAAKAKKKPVTAK